MRTHATLCAIVPAVMAAAMSTGCYHAIVETGRPAGATVVTRPFQPSFIYGLVPPPLLNVAGQCPGGVARVETLHTFVEGLVGAITAGIFTPMTIVARCASSVPGVPGGSDGLGGTARAPRERVIDIGRATEAGRAAIAAAARRSERTGRAVYVRF